MEALLALFRFYVPYFAAASDADVQRALELSVNYRPACLPAAKQDEAQIFFAAALLYDLEHQRRAVTAEPIPFGVKSEKEGDLARTYGTASAAATDALGFFARYDALASLCRYGAITVGNRYRGPCC